MADARPHAFPKLRAVDVRPSRAHPQAIELFDPGGITETVLSLSPAAFTVLVLMDGTHDRPGIQAEFMRRHGRMLFSDELDELIRQLDKSLFLEGGRFAARMEALQQAYRSAPHRPIRNPETLGAPLDRLGAYFDSMLDGEPENSGQPILGLIAPHLDYDRGRPCYAAAYRNLAERTDATRFIILGTNHFGRSAAVVGTRKDFDTPFGVVPCDVDLMDRLDARCGTELCANELDHAREHSIELQVLLLKHLLGPRRFTIAPFLCPDPCGDSGTAPRDGRGIDLKDFAAALRAELDADGEATCLIAGADLSHVGRFFQDDRALDANGLGAVERSDRQALEKIEASDPEGFRLAVASRGNDTNICSVGCIYVLSSVLREKSRPQILHYHRAVVPKAENCVTCAAVEFVREP